MHPTPLDWQRAFVLMDEGLALPPAQQQAWLAATAASDPHLMPLLHKLLDAHGRVEAHQILATLPKVMRGPRTAHDGAVGMQVGPFALTALLGRGGMGSVWRARYADGRLKREVAVKLPASADDPAALATLRERFARERDFLAQLAHPHIARLYDAGISDAGQPYLAMEFVDGQPIDSHCDAQRLTVKARLLLYLQVLDAVAHAHQHLVLHRDLKPGNVLVDAQGQVRLLDFGVASLLPPPPLQDTPAASPHLTGGSLTEQAGAAFTLGHAAPEQVQRAALSTATDVYALGVMLYRLLTGLSPYQPARDTRGALEDAVLLATPADASTRRYETEALAARQCTAAGLRRALAGDLDVILGKALKKSPGERYATVTALADDLRRHLAQQPIAARPDSAWYRSQRFVARHRPAVLATALAAVALMGTAGVAVWQAGVSADNAGKARKEAVRASTAQKFFAGLLSNADPEKNQHITRLDLTLVDQALATAERDFAADPETLALVLRQLGDLYQRFDVPARYLDVQRKRVALHARAPGQPTDDIADARIELARALSRSPVPDERAQALPAALAAEQFASAHGAGAGLVVTALCLISDLHMAQSNDPLARDYAQRAVAHALQARPTPQAELALADANLGIALGKLGDFDGARKAFRDSIAIDAGAHGRGKIEQVHVRVALANLESEAGHYEAARREALDVVEFARQNLGEMEGTLTPARVRAVLATVAMGDFDAAWQLAQRLLPVDIKASDPLRSGLAHYVNGVAAMMTGRLAEAEQAYLLAEPGVAIRPRIAAVLQVRRAELALRQGRPAQALGDLQGLLQRAQSAGLQLTEETALAHERAGVALARQGQRAQAQAAFEAACVGRRARLAPGHPIRVRCEAYLLLAGAPGAQGALQGQINHQLALLREGGAGRVALAGSLRAALLWAANPTEGGPRFSDFPLLN